MLQLIIDIFLFFLYAAGLIYLVAITWRFWLMYIHHKYLHNLDWRMLEIKLPREINKSPEAAEIFLRSIIQTGGLGPWWKVYWLGNLPHEFSLEIASLEGTIHFYIRTQKKFIDTIQAAIYSQYPDVEIVEAEDYVNLIEYDHKQEGKGVGLWGTTWALKKKIDKNVDGSLFPDEKNSKLEQLEYSGDIYPIKTYKNWGLDKNEKEMYKHDPLTYLLESMASIGKGEYYWHQIIVRAAATGKNEWDDIYEIKGGKYAGEHKKLDDLVKQERERLNKSFSFKKEGDSAGDDEYGNLKSDKDGKEIKYAKNIVKAESIKFSEMPDYIKEDLKSISTKMSKPRVFAKMRTIYLSEPGKFNPAVISMHMTPIVSPFNEDGFNTLSVSSVADPTDFPWEDVMKRVVPWRKQELNDEYKDRYGFFSHTSAGEYGTGTKLFYDLYLFRFSSHFRHMVEYVIGILRHPFYIHYVKDRSSGVMCLNLEELATLYHFPGEVAATPGLPRIDSVKGSAPANLPR